MKKRLIRYKFNMVEIALALAVLAIGISSILVLFPVGINANRAAIADNNLADISEYLMGYLRAGCVAEWTAKAKGETPANSFVNSIPNSEVTTPSAPGKEAQDVDAPSGTQVTDRLYRIASTNDGVFLYRQMSGDIVDFAAVVRIWKSNFDGIEVPVLNGTSGPGHTYFALGGTGQYANFDSYAQAYCIEISWPAQAPYDQREKRLFRMELFNEAYRN